MDYRCRGSVSCVIHPLPQGKVRQSYISQIFWLLYFLLFLKGVLVLFVLDERLESLVSVCIGRLMEQPPRSLIAFTKGLGTCAGLTWVRITLYRVFWKESKWLGLLRLRTVLVVSTIKVNVSIIFEFSLSSTLSSQVWRFCNSEGSRLLNCCLNNYLLCGSVLPVLTHFIFNRSQYVVVDGYQHGGYQCIEDASDDHISVLGILYCYFKLRSFSQNW